MSFQAFNIPNNGSFFFIDTRTTPKVLYLPTVSTNTGRLLTIKDRFGSASNSSIVLSTTGADLIDGTNFSCSMSTSYGSISLLSDGARSWQVTDFYNGIGVQVIPAPLASVSFSASSSTGNVSYSAVSGATSYTTQLYSNTTNSYTGGTLVSTVTNGNTTQSFTNLFGLFYWVQVVVTNTAGSSPPTQSSIVPFAPTAPVTATLASSGAASWSAVTGATSYTVQLFSNSTASYVGATQQSSGSFGGTSTTFTINSSSFWFIRVSAVNAGGSSAVKDSGITQSPPPAPTGQSTTSFPGYVRVAWSAVSGASSYSVNIFVNTSASTSGATLVRSHTTTDTSSGVALVTASRFYYATIAATNFGGTSAAAQTGFASTAAYTLVSRTYTGSDQSYSIPAGRTTITVMVLGSGGESSTSGNNGSEGGLGGLACGTLAVTGSETLTVIAGGYTNIGSGRSYGGGGIPGTGNFSGRLGGIGGGRSAIRRGATELVTAGGGGGSGYGNPAFGGAGGGLLGADGQAGPGYGEPWGLGGTQSAGGLGSDGSTARQGSQFQGGDADTAKNYAGGGGSGWYGGGAGSGGGTGGGGSSRIAGLTNAFTVSGGGAARNTAGVVYFAF